MGSDANRLRSKWQDYSGSNAAHAEHSFYNAFNSYFEDIRLFEEPLYEIIPKPKEFDRIYVDIQLSPEVQSEIFTPPEPVDRHGISPDFAIKNLKTSKKIYVEVKRQDGWVEEKLRR